MDTNPVLPCTNCPNKSARCSTHCKELHKFLRWTDKNRAHVKAQAREIHVSNNLLDVMNSQRGFWQYIDGAFSKGPNYPDWPGIAQSGIRYGALDLSYLSSAEINLYESRYIAEASIEDLAKKYEITEAGIKSRIKRIRRKIKEFYLKRLVKTAYPDARIPA